MEWYDKFYDCASGLLLLMIFAALFNTTTGWVLGGVIAAPLAGITFWLWQRSIIIRLKKEMVRRRILADNVVEADFYKVGLAEKAVSGEWDPAEDEDKYDVLILEDGKSL